MTNYTHISIVFACIAAHEAAHAINNLDPEDPTIVALANAAQCNGLDRVAGALDGLAPCTWGAIFHEARSAVNDALLRASRAGRLRRAEREVDAWLEDAARARSACMGAAISGAMERE